MIPVRILGTATVLPGRALTTAEMAARAVPPLDPAVVESKTGIRTRHFADPGTLISDLAAQAITGACQAAGIEARSLRRIILATSEGGDLLGPATANATIHTLGLDHRCDGFDVTNACMGFLSAFDLGARSVATGLGPVAIVASEILSRALRPDWPRPWVVFADAAAAVILGAGRPGEGIEGIHLANDGSLPRTVYAEHPLLTHQREWLRMDLPNRDVRALAVDALSRSAAAVLGPLDRTMASVDWVLPHQPNGAMLETIVEALGIPPEKIVPVVQDVGSVVAASIPISLDRLLRTRRVLPGDRILMIGVGSGIAYGAALYRVAPDAA